jgi:hypothetical protein
MAFHTKHFTFARQMSLLVSSLLIVFLMHGTASAQLTTATIVGTVADSAGAVIPRATVTVVNVDTHFTSRAVTSGNGEYRIELLPIGSYSLTAEATGFKKFVQTNIALTVNQQVHVDASLATGASAETITVTDEPSAIDLENGTMGRTIDAQETNNLPIVDRNIYSLLPLIPGVQSNVNGNSLGYPQEVVQINGGSTNSGTGTVSYYLDGGLNMTAVRMTGNQMPNPEALAEFNVQTSNYNVSYGRMSSGVVNAITKSGTNQFHGSLYEFHRETNFNSTPWHAKSRQPVHRNLFGGVVGGPIIRDRTFFFFDYSGFRNIGSNLVNTAILPTAKEAAGNFDEFLPTSSGVITSCGQTISAADKAAGNFIVCNPSTRKPYANNIITDPLDKAAQNILKALPAPNSGTALQPLFIGFIPTPATYNEYLGKIDHKLSERQRITGSYFYLAGQNTIQAGSGNLPWAAQLQKYSLHVINLSDTFTISPNKINQTWITYTRSFGGRINTPGTTLTDFGSTFLGQGQLSLPQITVSNYFTLSNAISGPTAGTNFYSARNLFILNEGKHSISLGGEASLNKDILLTELNNYGVYGFQPSTSARTGNALSDYMLGLISTQLQTAPDTAIDNSFFYSAFAQDDWHLLPNLTINAGLRWDIQTPPTDPQNKESTFIQGVQSVVNPAMPLGVLVPGDPGVTRGIVPLQFRHFSPRLGFAWDPFKNGKTSVRGAAGIFWGSVSGNEWNGTSNYYPFTLSYTFGVPGTLADPYKNTPNPFPSTYTPGNVAAAPPGTTVLGIDPNFEWPSTYQLSASVQQELTKSIAVGFAYVGSLARNLVFPFDKNYPIFNTANPTANTTTNINARRPIDTGVLADIQAKESRGTINYNAFQLTFSQRLTRGISFNGYYTWSKTMESYGLDSGAVVDYNNLKLEKGPTDTDQRNIFVTSLVWQPSYFKGNNRIVKAMVDGWTISTIINLRSGTPFSITTGTDNNADGYSPDRANQTANVYDQTINHGSRALEVKRWFNPGAFCSYNLATPGSCSGTGPAGSDGTSQRDGYIGPGQRDVDLAILRDFGLFENVKLQIRGEATNVFNLVSLSNPNGAINISGTTNQITSAAPMRQIQVGARLRF